VFRLFWVQFGVTSEVLDRLVKFPLPVRLGASRSTLGGGRHHTGLTGNNAGLSQRVGDINMSPLLV
jgi:hypothetical protein